MAPIRERSTTDFVNTQKSVCDPESVPKGKVKEPTAIGVTERPSAKDSQPADLMQNKEPGADLGVGRDTIVRVIKRARRSVSRKHPVSSPLVESGEGVDPSAVVTSSTVPATAQLKGAGHETKPHLQEAILPDDQWLTANAPMALSERHEKDVTGRDDAPGSEPGFTTVAPATFSCNPAVAVTEDHGTSVRFEGYALGGQHVTTEVLRRDLTLLEELKVSSGAVQNQSFADEDSIALVGPLAADVLPSKLAATLTEEHDSESRLAQENPAQNDDRLSAEASSHLLENLALSTGSHSESLMRFGFDADFVRTLIAVNEIPMVATPRDDPPVQELPHSDDEMDPSFSSTDHGRPSATLITPADALSTAEPQGVHGPMATAAEQFTRHCRAQGPTKATKMEQDLADHRTFCVNQEEIMSTRNGHEDSMHASSARILSDGSSWADADLLDPRGNRFRLHVLLPPEFAIAARVIDFLNWLIFAGTLIFICYLVLKSQVPGFG